MKEHPTVITDQFLQSEAIRLAKTGLKPYEVTTRLAKQYGSEHVARWLKLKELLQPES